VGVAVACSSGADPTNAKFVPRIANIAISPKVKERPNFFINRKTPFDFLSIIYLARIKTVHFP
jgi:hypothetical protein